MITNLREARRNLSPLVQLAADGEDVVITVRGRPTARLTGVVPKEAQAREREAWAAELSAAAEAARVGPRKATSQQFWDELSTHQKRDERQVRLLQDWGVGWRGQGPWPALEFLLD